MSWPCVLSAPFPKEKLDEIHKLTGKPILLCDFAIRFKDGDKDIRSWKAEENSVDAGKAYSDCVKAAIKADYIVGVFWTQNSDSRHAAVQPNSQSRVSQYSCRANVTLEPENFSACES